MISKLILALFFFLLSLHSFAEVEERVISMSPAITDTLFKFQREGRLVGVSEYCKTPKVGFEKVGSPFSPLVEKIVSLKPTVILTQDIKDTKFVTILDKLKLTYKSYSFNTLEDIQQSINKIAKEFKAKGIEDFNTDWLKAQYSLRKKQLSGNYLAVIGVKGSVDKIKGFVVAADDTYLGEILTSAGLTNLSPQKKGYGDIGLETFLTKDLHYLFYFSQDRSLTKESLTNHLNKQFKNLKKTKVFVFNGEKTLIPGPGVLELMKEISHVLP